MTHTVHWNWFSTQEINIYSSTCLPQSSVCQLINAIIHLCNLQIVSKNISLLLSRNLFDKGTWETAESFTSIMSMIGTA